MDCCTTTTTDTTTMEEYLRTKAKIEDQVDYQFIQRIVGEVTNSCALPMPVPAAAMPSKICQAFDWFVENYTFASEERWYCVRQKDINRCGPNNIIKLPPQIYSVCGVYPTTDQYNYGVMGDFSLERMILNNTALTSGVGGQLTDVFGTGTGYSLQDVTAGLYEVQQFKALFDSPLTYDYNQYSNDLIILGALRQSDLILDTFRRCKLQDMYKSPDFFRYCVCLVKMSLADIFGTYGYKLPGGVTINYDRFYTAGETELTKIEERIEKLKVADYFYNSNTI